MDKEVVADAVTIDPKYVKAVEAVLEGLAGSDFVSVCGYVTLRELKVYTLDMALTIQKTLEGGQ